MVAAFAATGLLGAGTAAGFGPVGPDPIANYQPVISACPPPPTSAACLASAVADLDRARASLGQPPYTLPTTFAALDPGQQAFVLANLDRVLYGLAPIPGLTDDLDQDAATGASSGLDPSPTRRVSSYTANWAGGFPNMPVAYEFWMYDDGLGSPNGDCAPGNLVGCWGHRHDVLWQFDNDASMAMGAAAAAGSTYAMLIVAGLAIPPIYTYTWAQAVADGAGTAAPPGAPVLGAPIANQPPPAGGSLAAPLLVPVHIIVRGHGDVVDGGGTRCSVGQCWLNESKGKPATFAAKPDSGAVFAGWHGPCSGTGVCTIVPLGPTISITAVFAPRRADAPGISGRGSTLVATAAGVVTARLRCVGANVCRGRARVELTIRRRVGRTVEARREILSAASYVVAAAATEDIALRLRRIARRLLTRIHKVTVTLTLTPASARASRVSRTMRLESHG